jgi:hypothetical protein
LRELDGGVTAREMGQQLSENWLAGGVELSADRVVNALASALELLVHTWRRLVCLRLQASSPPHPFFRAFS